MRNLKQITDELFSKHPSIDVIYLTADGNPFFEHHKAESHSARLKDKAIAETYRDNEAKQRCEDVAKEQDAERQKSFAAIFPELERSVKYNQSKRKA